MSGSDRTKNRIPVQVSRWAIPQHYSGREDLSIPADSVTDSPGAIPWGAALGPVYEKPVSRPRSCGHGHSRSMRILRMDPRGKGCDPTRGRMNQFCNGRHGTIGGRNEDTP